jgi:inorganic pyrophosphatase
MGRANYDVVIETPKGSTVKYVWDETTRQIRVKRVMPLGAYFPFNFGFFPGTLAEDGDPLDVLVLMDTAIQPGVVMEVRIIGALKVEQTKKETIRNDRIIAVQDTCAVYGAYTSLEDIPAAMRKGMVHFFKSYNEYRGQQFVCIGWGDAAEAAELIAKAGI